MNNYVYPLVIQSIISLYLVIRIVKEPSKTNLPQQSRGQSDENNGRPRARMPALSIREIASTKTIITLLIAELITSFPYTIVWGISIALEMLNPDFNSQILDLISIIFLILMSVKHLWNLYIYIWRFPTFAKEIYLTYCCKKYY